MRSLLFATTMIFGMSSAVYAGGADSPSAVQYRWLGDLTYTYQTASCIDRVVGDHLIARFRPSGLGANGPNSHISMFYSNYAQGFRVVGPFTPAWKQAQGQDIGAGFGTYPPATYVRFLTQSPAVIAPNTNIITATGSIFNFDYTVNCTVNFSVVLQPDLR